MSLKPRGVTLVEMVVAMALLVLVSGIVLQFLLRQHWSADALGQRAALQSNLRSAVLYLESELRELGGSELDPDLLVLAAESLSYRAMRGFGVTCSISSGMIAVRTTDFSGYRAAQGGRDSLLLYHESTGTWAHLPLSAVSGGSCAGAPALLFATSLDTVATPLAGFGARAPLKTFEIMQARLYQSGTDYWLGARSISAAEIIQPLAGPFQPHGLALTYLDSLGTTTTTPALVRSVDLVLRGLTAGPVRTGAGMGQPQRRSDSLLTRVTLRNR